MGESCLRFFCVFFFYSSSFEVLAFSGLTYAKGVVVVFPFSFSVSLGEKILELKDDFLNASFLRVRNQI